MLVFATILSLLATPDTTTLLAPGAMSRGMAEPASVTVHRQPSVPVVALRMSILANDPPGYAGAGHMIQHLLYPSLVDRVSRVGGHLQMQRTSDAIVYTATGPASELTYLAELLTSALRPGLLPADALLRVGRELREERLAEWETAPGHARSMLRVQLFPNDVSAAGTDRSATRFSSSTLPTVWNAIYDPRRVSVVAVGDVDLDAVQGAFSSLPERTEVDLAIQQDSVVLGPLAPAQATRAWLAAGYLATDLDPAAVTLTARLLAERLRLRVPTAQIDVEHWWTQHGQALAIVAAVPEPDTNAARLAIGTGISTLLDSVRAADVDAAAAAIRREMLFYSRTPDRMAEVIGQFVDRDGDPDAAARFYGALDSLDVDDVRDVLERLLERTPARVEIPPQALMPRRP